jgi:dienelactone hydrolase
MRFELSPTVTDRVEQTARWLADSGLAAGSRIGLMGVSFSGGLAIVAAGRPALRERVRFVFSFGGHDDFGAVVDYLSCATDAQTPHDYGVALVLLNVADRLVPADQVGPLRDAVRRFLHASYADRSDRLAAAREFEALRDVARGLPEPSATLLAAINDRDVIRLGPLLRPHAQRYVEQRALSPARSPAPAAPVFLLHGVGDTVIPPAESQRMADRLRAVVPVRLLVTEVITHAEANPGPHVADVWQLARFWGDLLAQ